MRGNRGRDTSPELALRRILFARGLRYRVNKRPIADFRRTADLVFGPAKVAVFVDGCFWHRCPDHYRPPRSNAEYWEPKIERNVERDRETDTRLQQDGWTVVRVWEHEDPRLAAHRIAEVVDRYRQQCL